MGLGIRRNGISSTIRRGTRKVGGIWGNGWTQDYKNWIEFRTGQKALWLEVSPQQVLLALAVNVGAIECWEISLRYFGI